MNTLKGYLLLAEEIIARSGIRYKSKGLFLSERTISDFISDVTLIKSSGDYVWLWVAIEPKDDKMILGIRISIERSMLVAEQFIQSLIRKHNISTDGGTWYPHESRFLNVEHHIHSSIE